MLTSHAYTSALNERISRREMSEMNCDSICVGRQHLYTTPPLTICKRSSLWCVDCPIFP